VNAAITATAPRTITACVGCLAGVPHDRHDADTVPLAVRTTVSAPIRKGAGR
jgi:hypothetical protein